VFGIVMITFSPDSKQVVSGSDDGAICLWDAAGGELVGLSLKCDKDCVKSVAFSSDGK